MASDRVDPFALAARFAVLLTLIGHAAVVYVRLVLHGRGVFPLSDEAQVAIQQSFARRFTRIAVRFRGGLIKLGQVASLRVDVLPEEVSAELARLQDRVDPHPVEEIRAQIEAELGKDVGALFASFDPQPAAAASLGLVHAATTREGDRVAVKVLYPGIERSVAVDLAATRLGLWLFDFVTVADLRQVYRELRESLLGEMDYVREGRAAEEVQRNLARDPEVARRVRSQWMAGMRTRRATSGSRARLRCTSSAALPSRT